MTKWNIQLYESLTEDKPIEEFILSLDVKAQDKIARTFDHLEEFGQSLGLPHMKKLTGTNLWELRILGGNSIRIFYVTITKKTFLLLHGFKKKAQKIPQREIRIAEKRLHEYKTRKSDT